ncbi:Alpha/Beta hydrolase protein [Aspergillus crustosus]
MSSTTSPTTGVSATEASIDVSNVTALTPAALAARCLEITGLAIFNITSDDIETSRVHELLAEMHEDIPQGGIDISYGDKDTQHLRYWEPTPPSPATTRDSSSNKAPLIVYVHGGSWRVGTNLDSIGIAKVTHLTNKDYAFTSVNSTLIPTVTVEEQVQEIANAVAVLIQKANAGSLAFDATRIVLMGHSSGAHVVSLLGTDTSYLQDANVPISAIRGVVALDGSNYNALAEITDSPGPIAENLIFGLGRDPGRLRAHVTDRSGDIRQAVEFVAALDAAGTAAELRVFDGEWFEGHVRILLALGDVVYPATGVLDRWLERYAPVG